MHAAGIRLVNFRTRLTTADYNATALYQVRLFTQLTRGSDNKVHQRRYRDATHCTVVWARLKRTATETEISQKRPDIFAYNIVSDYFNRILVYETC